MAEGGKTKRMGRQVSVMNPIMACDDMATRWGAAAPPRVAQMLRDPYATVISAYLYHSQSPTPEDWVHDYKPCFHPPGCVPNPSHPGEATRGGTAEWSSPRAGCTHTGSY